MEARTIVECAIRGYNGIHAKIALAEKIAILRKTSDKRRPSSEWEQDANH